MQDGAVAGIMIITNTPAQNKKVKNLLMGPVYGLVMGWSSVKMMYWTFSTRIMRGWDKPPATRAPLGPIGVGPYTNFPLKVDRIAVAKSFSPRDHLAPRFCLVKRIDEAR